MPWENLQKSRACCSKICKNHGRVVGKFAKITGMLQDNLQKSRACCGKIGKITGVLRENLACNRKIGKNQGRVAENWPKSWAWCVLHI